MCFEFSGARAFMLGFLPLLNLLDLFLTLDTSPLVPFGSCDGTSIFLHANVGLRLEGKKGSKQKSIIFLLWKKKNPQKTFYGPCWSMSEWLWTHGDKRCNLTPCCGLWVRANKFKTLFLLMFSKSGLSNLHKTTKQSLILALRLKSAFPSYARPQL